MQKKLLVGLAFVSLLFLMGRAVQAQSAYFQAVTNLHPVGGLLPVAGKGATAGERC